MAEASLCRVMGVSKDKMWPEQAMPNCARATRWSGKAFRFQVIKHCLKPAENLFVGGGAE